MPAVNALVVKSSPRVVAPAAADEASEEEGAAERREESGEEAALQGSRRRRKRVRVRRSCRARALEAEAAPGAAARGGGGQPDVARGSGVEEVEEEQEEEAAAAGAAGGPAAAVAGPRAGRAGGPPPAEAVAGASPTQGGTTATGSAQAGAQSFAPPAPKAPGNIPSVPLELCFCIARDAGAPRPYRLQAGEVLRVGRSVGPEEVEVSCPKASGQHLELSVRAGAVASGSLDLFARDTSLNGTGVRDALCSEPGARSWDFEELSKTEARVLRQGCELLLPLHAENVGAPLAGEQTLLAITFPDASVRAVAASASGAGPLASGLLRQRACIGAVGEVLLPDAYDEATGGGRWRYGEKLGEGGLGVVFLAEDATGVLGTVAVKISKWAQRDSWQVYCTHREAQWSRQLLHRSTDPRHDAGLAALFVRYLEDHTGFPSYGAPDEFEAVRHLYESPNLDWASVSFDPPLPALPYVVMELAAGRALAKLIDPGEDALTAAERRRVASQSASALEYLSCFGLIHRDFRGSNIMVSGREERCCIKVLDLGLAINATESQASNPNIVVQAGWQRRTREHDWVPPEVQERPLPNFFAPAHSFDAYSLGVLLLRLYGGKAWARQLLQHRRSAEAWRSRLSERGLGEHAELLERLLGLPGGRPAPPELSKCLASLAAPYSSAASTAPASCNSVDGVGARSLRGHGRGGRGALPHARGATSSAPPGRGGGSGMGGVKRRSLEEIQSERRQRGSRHNGSGTCAATAVASGGEAEEAAAPRRTLQEIQAERRRRRLGLAGGGDAAILEACVGSAVEVSSPRISMSRSRSPCGGSTASGGGSAAASGAGNVCAGGGGSDGGLGGGGGDAAGSEREDLSRLKPSALKERLRLAGVEVPRGVTEKSELVALLEAASS